MTREEALRIARERLQFLADQRDEPGGNSDWNQLAVYKSPIAARAVERAVGRVPRDAPLEALLKEALRHCE